MTEVQIIKCSKIAKHYGLRNQKLQAAQELNELQALLLRRKNQITNQRDHHNNIVDEIADCTIMIEQLRQLYNIEMSEISDRINQKLNRQIERMNNE